jgi:hypothetical protein
LYPESLLGTKIQMNGSRKRAIFICVISHQIKTRTAKTMRARFFRQNHPLRP